MNPDTSGVPYARHRWNQIIPNLFMGGHDYEPTSTPGTLPRPAVVRGEFQLVVSLYRREGHGPGAGTQLITYRIPDGRLDSGQRAQLDELAEVVADAVRAGRKTLVRCQAGYNRSGLVVALALLKLGYTYDEAIILVRKRRSRFALCNSVFVDYIREAAYRKPGAAA